MLELKKINKSYKTGSFTQKALKDVSLKFRKNEFVAILGASGSGKTTMLNIIGGLDRYDSGDLIINNKSTKKFKNIDWDRYRNNCIGFIFQSYNLIPHITILDNVEMAMTLSGVSARTRRKKAKAALKKVGLAEHIHKRPNQLSGGQMQRVAIARALVNDPEIILADEPTGALDTKTSVQIMELIKEIAEDKLVIMVTHNPNLANQYANRIIELSDGEIIDDSNPVKDTEEDDSTIKIKKTAMSFLTALKLSFNNIRTKKGRTILTAFASSIGIIGIALILALSNGFQIQIDKFEKDTLSQMPIIINQQTIVMDSDTQSEIMDSMKVSDKSYSDSKEIHPIVDQQSVTHYNDLDLDYIDYLEKMDKDLVGGLSYVRAISMNILHKNVKTEKIEPIKPNMFPVPEVDDEAGAVMKDNFEIIYGEEPKEYNEAILLLDINNGLDQSIFKMLGYSGKENITFDDILNQEFKIVLNDDYYTSIGTGFIPNVDYENLYKNNNNITLKITGIYRGKEGSKFAQYSGNGIMYKEKLAKEVMKRNESSDIVKAQRKADYNVITGELFDLTTKEGRLAKANVLAAIGGETAPFTVQLYPKDFKSKDKIHDYLDKYNESRSEEDKIIYTDTAETISSLSSGIMDAITVVLIAFSSISLIVSSIMIGIITYISVLERTKEIGILRALGARKKDIKRVFNAETFIIGFSSAVIGITIAFLLTFPINNIIEKITDLPNVARINPAHAIALIIINVVLTMLGGFIPARIASKKDPVESLRSE